MFSLTIPVTCSSRIDVMSDTQAIILAVIGLGILITNLIIWRHVYRIRKRVQRYLTSN